jgi:hypothetical protein
MCSVSESESSFKQELLANVTGNVPHSIQRSLLHQIQQNQKEINEPYRPRRARRGIFVARVTMRAYCSG